MFRNAEHFRSYPVFRNEHTFDLSCTHRWRLWDQVARSQIARPGVEPVIPTSSGAESEGAVPFRGHGKPFVERRKVHAISEDLPDAHGAMHPSGPSQAEGRWMRRSPSARATPGAPIPSPRARRASARSCGAHGRPSTRACAPNSVRISEEPGGHVVVHLRTGASCRTHQADQAAASAHGRPSSALHRAPVITASDSWTAAPLIAGSEGYGGNTP
jgi:hypothetical protein